MSVDFNTIQGKAWTLQVACSHPATPAEGDPVRFGQFTGVALNDEGKSVAVSTDTFVYFGPCIGDFSVKGINGGGNSAVAPGDALYYTDGDTPVLNKKTTGTFFGMAIGSVGSGSTATIQVLHMPSGKP